MNCPHCAVELRLSERKNIEIDYCPKCRGVWLDRGELDKLLESTEREYRPESRRDDDDRERREKNYGEKDHYSRHKKKSFLSEIFDF
jgi:uncharacterized protein